MPNHRTYTFGTTPNDVILKALREQLGNKPYDMTVSRSDEPVVVRCVNQGIDSHLEAITQLEHGREEGNILGNRLEVSLGHESLCVLLRRLFEDGSEAAWGLRGAILDSLGIEEV